MDNILDKVKDGSNVIIENNSFLERLIGMPKEGNVKTEQTNTEVIEPPAKKRVLEDITPEADDLETPEEEAARLALETKTKVKEDGKEESVSQIDKTKSDEISTGKSNSAEEGSVIEEFVSEFAEYGEIAGEFEESTDGLKDFMKALIPNVEAKAKQDGIAELFGEMPILLDFARHIAAGYGPDSFKEQFKAFDYSKIELKEGDEAKAEQYYRQALKARGNADEDVDSLVESAKDSGKLLDKGKAALSALDSVEKAKIEERKKAEKIESDKALKDEQDNIAEIDKILKSGNLAGIKLDATEIKALRAFGTVKDNKGVTERDRKYESLTLEQWLVLDNIVRNDFKGLGVKVNPAATKAKSLADLKKKSDSTKHVDITTSNSAQSGFKADPRKLFQNDL